MGVLGTAYTRQKLCLDFAQLKHACPKGVYVAPLPEEPLIWTGVLFVRKGPYTNAILRFRIDFPKDYPDLPPTVTIANDVFHPLVTPLTTYTYSARDTGADTVSARDGDRLPPGGLSLKHGFPQWYQRSKDGTEDKDVRHAGRRSQGHGENSPPVEMEDMKQPPPHTIEVLQYLRIVFSTEAILDSVPLDLAANPGAWHAWRSYRMKVTGGRVSPTMSRRSGASDATSDRSLSPRQQPGGARKPGEWNWQGVWEDRVKKSVQASISESTLYGGEGSEMICFSKPDGDTYAELMSSLAESADR